MVKPRPINYSQCLPTEPVTQTLRTIHCKLEDRNTRIEDITATDAITPTEEATEVHATNAKQVLKLNTLTRFFITAMPLDIPDNTMKITEVKESRHSRYKVDSNVNDYAKQIKILEKDVEEIKQSLNFHEHLFEEKIKTAIASQEKTTTSCIDKQNNNTDDVKIKSKLRDMEDRSRRNNLRVDGLKENEGETWIDSELKVSKVFEEHLGLTNIRIERAYRTGQRDLSKPRTIVLKLLDYKDKVEILKKTSQLNKIFNCKNIYINEDFCAETVTIRKSLQEQMKVERAAGKYAYISYDKLIIREWAPNKNDVNASLSDTTVKKDKLVIPCGKIEFLSKMPKFQPS
ncbi:uncharacterized protein LOC136093711 [Hydra vulgaris]|uniref:uncharacterized protein LOC136093711 n=1 Tax=Hydra vulgaris TaxID=6087 RepID=UPI0032EA4EAC